MTLHKAAYDIDQHYKSKASTLHPESEEVSKVRQYAKDHRKHRSYLVFERRSLRLIASSFYILRDLNSINCRCSNHEYLLHRQCFYFYHIISTLNYKPIAFTFVCEVEDYHYIICKIIIIGIPMIIIISLLLYHDHHHYIELVVWNCRVNHWKSIINFTFDWSQSILYDNTTTN
jgi:hypothetical protein